MECNSEVKNRYIGFNLTAGEGVRFKALHVSMPSTQHVYAAV